MCDHTGIVTKYSKINLVAIPGKHSIDSQQKTAILETSYIIRKVFQSETWSLSGGDHRWFKRTTTRKKDLWQETWWWCELKCSPSWTVCDISLFFVHLHVRITSSREPSVVVYWVLSDPSRCRKLYWDNKLFGSSLILNLIMKCMYLIAKQQKYLAQ